MYKFNISNHFYKSNFNHRNTMAAEFQVSFENFGDRTFASLEPFLEKKTLEFGEVHNLKTKDGAIVAVLTPNFEGYPYNEPSKQDYAKQMSVLVPSEENQTPEEKWFYGFMKDVEAYLEVEYEKLEEKKVLGRIFNHPKLKVNGVATKKADTSRTYMNIPFKKGKKPKGGSSSVPILANITDCNGRKLSVENLEGKRGIYNAVIRVKGLWIGAQNCTQFDVDSMVFVANQRNDKAAISQRDKMMQFLVENKMVTVDIDDEEGGEEVVATGAVVTNEDEEGVDEVDSRAKGLRG